MKIAVSSKNEYRIIPDIADNLDREEKDQFVIVMRKLSNLESGNWSSVTVDSDVTFNLRKKLRASLVRIINAPKLEVDGGKEEKELTLDILVSGEYAELHQLENILIAEMTRIETEEVIDVKK